jgi:hypothetical protein
VAYAPEDPCTLPKADRDGSTTAAHRGADPVRMLPPAVAEVGLPDRRLRPVVPWPLGPGVAHHRRASRLDGPLPASAAVSEPAPAGCIPAAVTLWQLAALSWLVPGSRRGQPSLGPPGGGCPPWMQGLGRPPPSGLTREATEGCARAKIRGGQGPRGGSVTLPLVACLELPAPRFALTGAPRSVVQAPRARVAVDWRAAAARPGAFDGPAPGVALRSSAGPASSTTTPTPSATPPRRTLPAHLAPGLCRRSPSTGDRWHRPQPVPGLGSP